MVRTILGWLAIALARLLAAVWQKEKPKVLSLSIPIGDKSLPLSAIAPLAEAIFPKIEAGIKARKSPGQIVDDVKGAIPAALIPVSETILNIIFPGAGTIEAAVVWLIANAREGGPVGEIFKRSEFAPQDPRFDRFDPSAGGG